MYCNFFCFFSVFHWRATDWMYYNETGVFCIESIKRIDYCKKKI